MSYLPREVAIQTGQPTDNVWDIWVNSATPGPSDSYLTASAADLRYQPLAHRNAVNYIRNGDMSVAQRGNGNWTTSGVYTVDGVKLYLSGGSVAMTRQPAAGSDLSAWTSTSVTGQSAATDYAQLVFPVEGANTANGKVVTLSFTAYANTGTPKISAEVQQNFGTGGTPSATVYTAVAPVTISTTAARYSMTFTIPATTSATFGTNGNDTLLVALWLSAGTNFNTRASSIGTQSAIFLITDVQLEDGSYASPFERLPQQQQLAWCQRYFWRLVVAGSNRDVSIGHAITTTRTLIDLQYPVTMRATPNFSSSGSFLLRNAAGSGQAVTAVSTGNGTLERYMIQFDVASGLVAGNASGLIIGPTGILDFSAEL